MFAWADVPGCLCKARPSHGAQRDRPGLSARPRHPLKPASPGQPDFLCRRLAKPRLPAPRRRLAPLLGGEAERGAIKGKRAESVVPSSLAPGPAFGLLKALLPRCRFSLVRTSKPELPNVPERSCWLPERRRGQAGRGGRGASCAGRLGAGLLGAEHLPSSAAWAPGVGGRAGGSGPSALAHEAPREAAGAAAKGRCEMPPGQGDALLQRDLRCTASVQARKTDFLQENTKKEKKVLPHAGELCLPR